MVASGRAPYCLGTMLGQSHLREIVERFLAQGYLPHFFAVAGFILAFVLVARLLSEKRAPANTFAWLLGIILMFTQQAFRPAFFRGQTLNRDSATLVTEESLAERAGSE